jgi:photosystem II stability/assembly factor-like uncharacterized protein/pimeloyl-ACP methyl ester carboxylesterase
MLIGAMIVTITGLLALATPSRTDSQSNEMDSVWASLGPQGADIESLAIDQHNSNTIYAGTSLGGIFKSTDGGASWNGINTGLNLWPIETVVIDPNNSNTIYAGVPSSIAKSIDGGSNWTIINTGLPLLPMTAIAVDPTDANTIYAGSNFNSGGLFKTVNGGANWTVLNANLAAVNVRGIVIDPNNHSTIYAATFQGVLKTTNGGTSWNLVNVGLLDPNVSSLVLSVSDSLTLYAASFHGGIFKSTNGGSSWIPINVGLTDSTVLCVVEDTSNPATMYAGTSAGLFKSIDQGNSWNLLSSGLAPSSVKVLAIDPNHPNNIYAGTNTRAYGIVEGMYGGVLKSTDGGLNWVTANNNLIQASVQDIAVDPQDSTRLYAGTNSSLGVLASSNSGSTWNTINNGLSPFGSIRLAIDPLNTNVIYAAVFGYGVFKSTNKGVNWNLSASGLNNSGVTQLVIDTTNPNILYATTLGGVFKSTDGATSWIDSSDGLSTTEVNTLAVDPSDSNILYAGTFSNAGGGVFKSINGGQTWTLMDVGITNRFVQALAIDPNNHNTVYAATASGGVFKTINAGSSWTAINNGLPGTSQVFTIAINPMNSNEVFVGTLGGFFGGVFRTTNAGASWVPFNLGLATTNIRSLRFGIGVTNPLYVGTDGRGIYVVHLNAPTPTPTPTPCTVAGCSASAVAESFVNLPVEFQATVTTNACLDSPIYDWDFGDGSPHGTQANSFHTYTTPGNYTWTMTVHFPGSVTCVKTGEIAVTIANPCAGNPEPSVADGITKLLADENDTSPIGDRTPVVLIHGSHGNENEGSGSDDITQPNRNYFANLLANFNNKKFRAKYKVYRFHYVSDKQPVAEIARALRNDLDARICVEPAFDKPFIIIAHSLGGLVARSYLNDYVHYAGIYQGRQAGDRVTKLVTLATPHHGSPGASGESREEFATNQEWRLLLGVCSYLYWDFTQGRILDLLRDDEPNRSDLRWDNFNNIASSANGDINVWLLNLARDEQYADRISAYIGYIKPDDPARIKFIKINSVTDSHFGQLLAGAVPATEFKDHHFKLLLANVVMDYGMGHRFSFNDGLVPIESAGFQGNSQIGSRVICPNYDHLDMKDGNPASKCTNNLTLFQSVNRELGLK